jgi:hypothetical protein
LRLLFILEDSCELQIAGAESIPEEPMHDASTVLPSEEENCENKVGAD